MRSIKILLAISICFACAQSGLSQYSYKQHVKYANKSFEQGNYQEALIHYKMAYERAEYLEELETYQYAESAYRTFSLTIAQEQFENYLEIDSAAMEYDAMFKLARIAHFNSQYDQAATGYNLFLSEYGDDYPKLAKEAEFYLKQVNWARDTELGNYIETVKLLEGPYNSPYSESAPYVLDDSIYYSSLRFLIEDDDLDRYVSRLFRNEDIYPINHRQPDQLASNISFSPDTTFAIFSLCDYDALYKITCKLYYAKIDSVTGRLISERLLPTRINRSGSTFTQPSIRKMPEGYLLYYSSDQPGGKGKRDIWQARFSKDLEFHMPENLAYLNTERDEVTPFYHENSKELYFSSDGHRGYGGYDIYKIKESVKDSSAIVNLGDLVNSSYNDLHPFVNKPVSEIYFTSNRPGSQFLSSEYETCCYDIYKAEAKECSIDLEADFFDSFDNTPLSNVNVQVIDKTNDVVIYKQTLTGPQLNISLDCDKEYEIVAIKKGYEDLNYPLDDLNPIYGKENKVRRDIYLDPSEYTLTVKLYDEEEPDMPLYNAVVTLIEEDTGEEKQLSNGNTHIYNFEIKPKTSYTIVAEKIAYDDKIVNFNSGVGEPDIEKMIYLKKTEIVKITKVSLKNAIPVQLYFDNDEPDKKTSKTTSSQNYTETFYKYYAKKDKFKDVYADKFPRSEKDEAKERIDKFFEQRIRSGFDKYEEFKKQLLIVLEAGQKVNIYLRGYASPVHDSEYNIALGKRRVDSVRKEFDEWRDGIFLPYLESGQLVVTERSFGEETAPGDVSDDPRTPGASIYSPEASIERRVEIDEINFDEN